MDGGTTAEQSVPVQRLRVQLTGDDAEFARTWLKLDPAKNRLMLPKLADPDHLLANESRYRSVLEKLKPPEATFDAEVGPDLLAVDADSAAACLFAARLLGNPTLSKEASDWAMALRERMRAGIDDVLAVNTDEATIRGNLPDYVSYVNLAWEMYVSTGDEDWLHDGTKVLVRAKFLFAGQTGDVYPSPVDSVPAGWEELFAPEVVDSSVGGSEARFALFSTLYGRVPGLNAGGFALRKQAATVCDRTAWIVDQLDAGASTLVMACQATRGPALAYVGTPDWPTWWRRFPQLTIVPGGRALAGRAPGVYKAGAEGWSGPLSQDDLGLLALANRM